MPASTPWPACIPLPTPTPVLYPYPPLPSVADTRTDPYFPGMALSRSTSQKANQRLDSYCRAVCPWCPGCGKGVVRHGHSSRRS
jgi:hypothetical protein